MNLIKKNETVNQVIETENDYFAMAQNIVNYFLSNKRTGEIASYSEIENLIGYAKDSYVYMYAFAKARDLLIDKGITLRTIVGAGYKILSPNEIADFAVSKLNLASNRINTVCRIIANTDTESLTDVELEQLNSVETVANKLNVQAQTLLHKADIELRQIKLKMLE